MAGRRIELAAGPDRDRRGPGRVFVLGLGCLALIGLGVAIGIRIASRGTTRPATVTVTVRAAPARKHTRGAATPQRHPAVGYPRTASGAVAVASAFISALDGRALLDSSRVRAIIRAAVAPSISGRLLAAYGQAAAQAKAQLGFGTVPAPVVIVRAASVGYRIEHFSADAATVSLWRVGIIGSGATVQPEQSWRTEAVSLVWANGGWKIAALASQPGPTPPLASSAVSTPAELFTSIPRFEEFTSVNP